MPRSSSGLGRWVFIPEITGSTPVRGTNDNLDCPNNLNYQLKLVIGTV